MPRYAKDESLNWINVKIADLAADIQADIASLKTAIETEKTLKDTIRDKMVRDAKANGKLADGQTFKLSFFYMNRDEQTIGFVPETATAKSAKKERVFAESGMFANGGLVAKSDKSSHNARQAR